MDGLTFAESAQFSRGDVAFNNQLFHSGNGLGPIFNATSCVSCHAGDGKGTPFTAFKRFGQSDSTGNKFLDRGGPQLQDRALPGYNPETLPEGAPFTTLVANAVTGLGFCSMLAMRLFWHWLIRMMRMATVYPEFPTGCLW